VTAEPRTPRAPEVLQPLIAALRAQFPEAQFAHRESPDGLRSYLDVVTDCEDDFAVAQVAAPAAIELLLARGVTVHVFPFRQLPAEP
jgi:hypothetical protein